MMVVKQKTTQPVESDEELVNQFSSTGRGVHKSYLYSRMLVQLVKVEPQPIEVERSRSNGYLSCIQLLIYTPKSSKSNFVLNHLKLDDFIFSTKIFCQMFFKLV